MPRVRIHEARDVIHHLVHNERRVCIVQAHAEETGALADLGLGKNIIVATCLHACVLRVYVCVCECIMNMCVRAYVCVFAIPLYDVRYVFVVYVCDAMGRGSNELVLAHWFVVEPSVQGSFGLEDGPLHNDFVSYFKVLGGKEPASSILLPYRRLDMHAVLLRC